MTTYHRTKLGPRLIPFFKEIVTKTSVFLESADDGKLFVYLSSYLY